VSQVHMIGFNAYTTTDCFGAESVELSDVAVDREVFRVQECCPDDPRQKMNE